jgi:hypothetical protein
MCEWWKKKTIYAACGHEMWVVEDHPRTLCNQYEDAGCVLGLRRPLLDMARPDPIPLIVNSVCPRCYCVQQQRLARDAKRRDDMAKDRRKAKK